MALKRTIYGWMLRSEVVFALILAAGWCIGAVLVLSPGRGIVVVSFCAIATLSTLVVLAAMGYFDPLRLIPRRSDLLLVVLGVPIGGGVGRLGVAVSNGHVGGTSLTLLGVSLGIAVLTFLAHVAWCTTLVKRGRRRTIVLAVSEGERTTISESVFPPDIRSYLDFGTLHELRDALEGSSARAVDLIVISRAGAREFDGEGVLLRAHLAGIPIVDARRLRADLSGRIRVDNTDLWSYLLEATPQTSLLRLFATIKVGSEPLIALLLAVLLAPIFVVLCVAIPLTGRGPIFYRQKRTGYLGRPFTLVKFRSMRVDAEAAGVRWASDNDDRTTTLGRWMRRTRLDELPQLWNVMRGEMSFCGPRPERPEIYAALAREIPLFPLRTLVRPGITGWAQVYAGYAASVAESALKLEYDLFYIQNLSPRLDLIVLAKTIAVAVCGDAREARVSNAVEGGVPIHPRVL